MILVAGLTPAWQKILRFGKLRLGEVNRAGEAFWCASGKVLNVGLAAVRLGGACRAVSPVGGPARDDFFHDCSAAGLEVDWIALRRPTRVCTTLVDDATGGVTELVENAASPEADELQAFHAAFRRRAADAATIVFTGSLPTDVPATFYRELAEATTARIVADVRGAELAALVDGPRKPFLVKPNREELAATVGRKLDDDAALHRAMFELNRGGAEWVVVSSGPHAVWCSSRGRLWRAVPPAVERVVNPIGCGDCLTAGIAAALDHGDDVPAGLRLGMAAAADNLSSLRPAEIDLRRIERTAAAVVIEPYAEP